MKIQDGSGDGYFSKVDSTNRLRTRAITSTSDFEAVQNGDHYAITSGPVTLTSDTISAMFYFKNNESNDLYIDRFIFNTDDSVGGADSQFIMTMYKNPTGMSSGSGNPLGQVNTNFGSSKTLELDSEKGLEGATIDGGSIAATWRIENPSRQVVRNVRLMIPRGSSIGIAYTPPTSNTSMTAIFAVNAHLIKEDD